MLLEWISGEVAVKIVDGQRVGSGFDLDLQIAVGTKIQRSVPAVGSAVGIKLIGDADELAAIDVVPVSR